MAGFYPDVPANRFAYHLDGTKVFGLDASNVLTELTAAQTAIMNDEDSDWQTIGPFVALIFIFPELRDISGYYFDDFWGVASGALQSSTDTTTGLDGTWTSIVNPWLKQVTVDPLPTYRTAISPATAGSIKALKFNFASSSIRPAAVHLYGSIPATSNPDRLIFWEPTNNVATTGAYFDWGDVVQGTSQTKQFRIKNNSSTLTANSINLSTGAETFAMSVTFSTDNVTYNASINIGNLAPGALSSVLYVKRTVPAAEPLRIQACRMKASAGSWT